MDNSHPLVSMAIASKIGGGDRIGSKNGSGEYGRRRSASPGAGWFGGNSPPSLKTGGPLVAVLVDQDKRSGPPVNIADLCQSSSLAMYEVTKRAVSRSPSRKATNEVITLHPQREQSPSGPKMQRSICWPSALID